MKFRIEGQRFVEYLPKVFKPEPPKEIVPKPEQSSVSDSKKGENNLYALMQKNLLLKDAKFAPLKQNPPIVPKSTVPNPASAANQITGQETPPDDNQPKNFFSNLFEKILKRFDFDLPPNTPDPETNENLTMGNPSGAKIDVNQPENYLLNKNEYAASYNRDRGTPNWTSWHLDADSLGSSGRQNNFRPDDTLPEDWYHVTPADYSGSGYDRGHMTPSGDRTSSVEANSETFLMTNMIPQAPKNNQQTWANLENYSRTLVGQGNELYIVSGGSGTKEYIADGRVAVPESTWKVILVQPEGTKDVSRVTAETRVIAVNMPNDNSVNTDWRQYRVSTDSIEAETGYDFFSNVPDSVENSIESTVDAQ